MRWLVFFFLFSKAFCQICVYVDTQDQRDTVSIPSILCDSSMFTKTYLQKLRETVCFDFKVNSRTELCSTGDLIIQLKVQGEHLLCDVTTPHTSFSIHEIKLNGELLHDKKQCHRLSDTLYEALYHEKGIANQKIIYTKRSKETTTPYCEIYEILYDGSCVVSISEKEPLALSPIYVPTEKGRSNYFIYVSYIQGQPKLCIHSLKDSYKQKISNLPGSQLMPAFSSQKRQLTFVNDATGNPEFYIQKFDDKQGLVDYPKLFFTAPHGAQASPTFSPVSNHIAFVSNKDGYPRIYILELLPQAEPQLLTKHHRENTSPAWSPDGKYIVYSAKTDGIRQLWVYQCDTAQHLQLTFSPGHKENPAWAPNSIHLMYNTTVKDSQIFLIDLRTKIEHQITKGIGEKRFPAWEPFSS